MEQLADLNLRHLYALTVVVARGGISAAAPQVNLSQPALTQAIAKLERQLQSPLFDRQPGGMAPTEAAQLLVPRIERALAYIAHGVRLARRLPNGDWLLRHGAITPQDEGSQWLVHCLPLQAHESVLDYCAGAGDKALALAALLNDQGRVTATDFDAARLTRLAPRAAQASAKVTVLAFPPSPELRFDGVLVDAPCSGTGSLRRAPERRLDTPDIAALAELQGQVLADAARHVAPGGWLVYATCSVLTAENEAVIQAFTAAQGAQFTPCPLKTPEGGSAPTIRLWPHRHNTDGFFAAGWRRAG